MDNFQQVSLLEKTFSTPATNHLAAQHAGPGEEEGEAGGARGGGRGQDRHSQALPA